MQLNDLYGIFGAKKKSKRVGRGIGSGKGKTSGRGVKGQKSRSGVAIKGFEGGQMPMIARLPKRGFNCPSSKYFTPVNFVDIKRLAENALIKAGDIIDKATLVRCGVIKSVTQKVKLLGSGELNIKLDFILDAYSTSAKDAVSKMGGTTS
jgi:large subunit ribosomal protein L15